MGETFAVIVSGFSTAIGVVQVAQGSYYAGTTMGMLVLLALGALWFMNAKLFA